jgi:hypothetical protein
MDNTLNKKKKMSGVQFQNSSATLNADLSALVFSAVGLPVKVTPFNILEGVFAQVLNTNLNLSSNFIQQPGIISGVVFLNRIIANFTPIDFNGVGLYKKVGNLLILVAQSIDNPNIFDTLGYRVVPFITSYQSPGNELLYAALMHNRSATVTSPQIGCHTTLGTSLAVIPNNIAIFGQVAPAPALAPSLSLITDVLAQQQPRWLALV